MLRPYGRSVLEGCATDAATTDSEDAAASLTSIHRESRGFEHAGRHHKLIWGRELLDTHPPFVAEGGYYREEAIMMLRRFYMSENQNGE